MKTFHLTHSKDRTPKNIHMLFYFLWRWDAAVSKDQRRTANAPWRYKLALTNTTSDNNGRLFKPSGHCIEKIERKIPATVKVRTEAEGWSPAFISFASSHIVATNNRSFPEIFLKVKVVSALFILSAQLLCVYSASCSWEQILGSPLLTSSLNLLWWESPFWGAFGSACLPHAVSYHLNSWRSKGHGCHPTAAFFNVTWWRRVSCNEA